MAAITVPSPSVDGRLGDRAPRLSRDGDRTVVWLHGDQDVATASLLAKALAAAIAIDDADLVLDLSDVDFVGAAAVSVVIRGRRFLQERSRKLVLRSPSRGALRLLDACGLSGLVDPGSAPSSPRSGPGPVV